MTAPRGHFSFPAIATSKEKWTKENPGFSTILVTHHSPSLPVLSPTRLPRDFRDIMSATLISLRDALHMMDAVDQQGKPVHFSMSFVKKGTGEILDIAQAHLPEKSHRDSTSEVKPNTQLASGKKNPHHWKNMTRNFVVAGTDQIRKFHIRLLIKFNGKQVYY